MNFTPRRLITVLALTICASLSTFADDRVETRLVTITGEAEVKIAPDEVVFDLTVQSLHKDLRTAKGMTDDRLRKVLDLTRKYKVAAADVQTDYIKLEPRYRGNDEGRLFLGYSVRKDVVFTLRDISLAEPLLSELIETGISRINGVNFQTSQLRKYRDQARALAIKAAQEKAIALSGEIGQKIGKAYSIEEEVPQRSSMGQNYSANNAITSFDNEPTNSEGTLALGQIKISARVTVRFELN
jgi:uncharacterized protein YggE